MKKVLLVMVLALSCFAVFASGSQENSNGNSGITLKFSMSNSADTPHGRTAIKWAEDVDKGRSEGKTTIQIVNYPNGQLGSVSEMFEQIGMGEPVILATDASALKSYVSDIGVLDAPYFFPNENAVEQVLETQWFKDQVEALHDEGIQVLVAKMIYGSRHIMSKGPIHNPSEMRGVKLRVPSNDLSISMIEAMGGIPTAMPLNETYAGIQQGIIDGMENPLATHVDNSMWEVCKYLSLTSHQITISFYVMSADVFDSLSEADQEFLLSTADAAGDYFNSINGQANEEALGRLTDNGVEVIQDVDIDAFKKATESVYEKFGWTEIREQVYQQANLN